MNKSEIDEFLASNEKKLIDWGFKYGVLNNIRITEEKKPFILWEIYSRVNASKALLAMGYSTIYNKGLFSRYDFTATSPTGEEVNIETKHRLKEYDDYVLSEDKYNTLKGYDNVYYMNTFESGSAYIWDINSPVEYKSIKHSTTTAVEGEDVEELAPHFNINNCIYSIDDRLYK